MTLSQYNAKFFELFSENFKLTYVSGYDYAGETKYAGIWEKFLDSNAWYSHTGIDLTNLQQKMMYYGSLGFHLTHINSYQSNGNILYAAIWEYNAHQKTVEVEKTLLGFNNVIENYYYTGFQIKHITGASRNGQSLFLGAWENQGTWNSDDLNHISNTVTNYMSQLNIPGSSLALVKDGRLVYAKGFGFMDLTTQEPVGSKTLFRTASVSKTITSATLMIMIENNPNLLSSTIFGANGILGNEYGSIPYSNNEKALTLKQLLEHTAGGTAWGPQNDPMFLHMYLTNKQFIGWILDTRDPDLLPGSYYAYSNFGYHLLGRVIEKLSGISYESYVQENVLKQCGITDMHIGGNLWTDRRYFMIYRQFSAYRVL